MGGASIAARVLGAANEARIAIVMADVDESAWLDGLTAAPARRETSVDECADFPASTFVGSRVVSAVLQLLAELRCHHRPDPSAAIRRDPPKFSAGKFIREDPLSFASVGGDTRKGEGERRNPL